MSNVPEDNERQTKDYPSRQGADAVYRSFHRTRTLERRSDSARNLLRLQESRMHSILVHRVWSVGSAAPKEYLVFATSEAEYEGI